MHTITHTFTKYVKYPCSLMYIENTYQKSVVRCSKSLDSVLSLSNISVSIRIIGDVCCLSSDGS